MSEESCPTQSLTSACTSKRTLRSNGPRNTEREAFLDATEVKRGGA